MKAKAYTLFTDSHSILKDKFIETFKWEESLDLSVRYLPQVKIDGIESTEWKCKQFAETVKSKMYFFLDILSELQDGDFFIYLDCDIVFKQKIKDAFIDELGDYDCAFQKDGDRTYCTGCFICRVSPITRLFFQQMLDDYDKFRDDQDCINHGLRGEYKDTIKSKFLSKRFLNFGMLRQKRFKVKEDLLGISIPDDTVLFHANYTVGIENKLVLLKWFIGCVDNAPIKKKLSILICTVNGREEAFSRLMCCLNKQITKDVEVLIEKDDGKMIVGKKRNLLLDMAKGDYCCFIDDDGLVSENYVKQILIGIGSNPDCLSLRGIMTKDGQNPVDFYHSIKYTSWGDSKDENGKFFYYRCPNHLNVIRTDISRMVRFNDKIDREDAEDFSLRVSKHLKTEKVLSENVIYYYLCVTKHIPVKESAIKYSAVNNVISQPAKVIKKIPQKISPIYAPWRT